MKAATFLLLSVLLAAAAWASEPGQPLDCSDWVFTDPGLSCARVECGPADPNDGSDYCVITDNFPITVSGEVIRTRLFPLVGSCPVGSPALYRHALVRFDGTTETIIGYVDDRCADQCSSVDRTELRHPHLDVVGGRLYVPYLAGVCGQNPKGTFVISGFATLFEILQSYNPAPIQNGFRVPAMPEGMAAADYFDTYWGDLSTVGNWSQAHGLQCIYPTTAPARGDYLTVTDTLPTPQPGHGYYYVTAATYQGQTRYGRKTAAGRITGRDPALLPACSAEAQR